MNISFFIHNVWIVIAAAIIGGRIGHIFLHFSEYQGVLHMLSFWDENANMYTALLAAGFVLWRQSRQNEESFTKWADFLAIGVVSFLFFINVSDFFSGENYGSPPTFTWAPGIVFNSQEIPYTIPLHPVQIYASIWILVIIAFIHRYFRKKRWDGNTALIVSTLYFLGEFFLEFLRGTPEPTFFGYRYTQLLSGFFFFISLALLVTKIHNDRMSLLNKTEQPQDSEEE